jgi:glycosyltransferase involved in cell wall biosynthesis
MGRPLRIAMVTDAIFPYHRGGKEIRTLELGRRLAQDADVRIYTMRWWGRDRTRTEAGVTYVGLCRRIPLYTGERRSIIQAVVFGLACLQLMFARFDVIEADHMPYMPLFTLRLVSFVRRKPLVATWHEYWGPAYWREYLGRPGIVGWWIERWAMRLPDAIIAASDETATRLREELGLGSTVTVAPNGVDATSIATVMPAPGRTDLVNVGRLTSHKRVDLLLDAVARLKDSGVVITCRIVGDGPERERLHDQAQRLDISDQVEFLHDIAGQRELYALLKAGSVFAFPSEREGFGIAVLEAMACGLPVVATSAPDNLARHLVDRSDRGEVVSPSVDDFAQALLRALASAPDDAPDPEPWVGEFDWHAVAATVRGSLQAARDGGVVTA